MTKKPAKPIPAIAALRNRLDLGLVAAKALVDAGPDVAYGPVASNVAIALRFELRQLGTELQIDPVDPSSQPEATQRPSVVAKPRSVDSIMGLAVPARVVSALLNGKITTITALVSLTPQQLAEIENLGPKAIADITDALSRAGLELE